MFRNIVVAVDQSRSRHSALRAAGEMARLTGAKVQVVHVAASAIAWNSVVRLEEDVEADETLKEALAALREMGIGADGETVRAMDRQVPHVIAQFTERVGADLLVLGPHHRGAVAAFFNPRVSDAAAHATRIAVLLAPEPGTD
ncbi:universal stress protein [Streptomyces sp. 4503]|uniref:Universal stress protein n=1 Tax=Streptomyces niphimycinicus TaxID=2842201 RepID=A0ABS6CJ30_9ACTN|nr:universal stress protein [Streptomyces niphimycinicus]MBU3866922.1 universal stress protein [Streptomyces niphimycinicus]